MSFGKVKKQRTGSRAVLENDVHKWAPKFQNKEVWGKFERWEKYIFTVLAENVYIFTHFIVKII